jgi:hypothetical protein
MTLLSSCQLKRSTLGRTGLLIVPLLLVGCGASSDRRTDGERRLQTLAQMYTRCAATHKGIPPADEKAFKEFINGIAAEEKAAMKITNVDELFVSPRDQQPFKVRYGQRSGGGVPGVGGGAPGGSPPDTTVGPGSGAPGVGLSPIIAYEQTGANGKRYVAFATGEVREVSADEAQGLNLN